jgi:hypothetical protein
MTTALSTRRPVGALAILVLALYAVDGLLFARFFHLRGLISNAETLSSSASSYPLPRSLTSFTPDGAPLLGLFPEDVRYVALFVLRNGKETADAEAWNRAISAVSERDVAFIAFCERRDCAQNATHPLFMVAVDAPVMLSNALLHYSDRQEFLVLDLKRHTSRTFSWTDPAKVLDAWMAFRHQQHS